MLFNDFITVPTPIDPNDERYLLPKNRDDCLKQWHDLKEKIKLVSSSLPYDISRNWDKLIPLLPTDIINDSVIALRKIIARKFITLNIDEKLYFEAFFNFIDKKPLGSWDFDLVEDPLLVSKYIWLNPIHDYQSYYPLLRNACERYLRLHGEKKQGAIKEIEKYLVTLKNKESDDAGTNLRYEHLNRYDLIIKVHASNDQNLIALFSKYLPIPRSAKFKESVPEHIKTKEMEENIAIIDFLHRNREMPYDDILDKIKVIQRHFRANKRQIEEINRIENIRENEEQGKQYLTATQYIESASKPYLPKGGTPELRRRIVSIADNIKLVKGIKHYTKRSSLKDIFDDAFYGRRTLLQLFKSFKPAALSDFDVYNGDGNVICFTSDYGIIDTSFDYEIELFFDITKIKKSKNKTVFYKQFDFGFNMLQSEYEPESESESDSESDTSNCSESIEDNVATRIISIPKQHKNIVLSKEMWTSACEFNRYDVRFHIGLSDDGVVDNKQMFSIDLPQFYFISYNIAQIDQILILNFFRVIDSLATKDEKSKQFVHSIYAMLEKLKEKDLKKFLIDLGEKMSDTMEFNFYGAHQIDFETLNSIECADSGKKLKLNDLINELKEGKLDLLQQAKDDFPEIFKSARFIQFLQSKTEDTLARIILDELIYSDSNTASQWKPLYESKFRQENEANKENVILTKECLNEVERICKEVDNFFSTKATEQQPLTNSNVTKVSLPA
ncbi:MAG: hypothetical protein JSR17_10425 [Proteobacteria bacterium]|nr:hypothetical protein [Pseudomonadota bacterium]